MIGVFDSGLGGLSVLAAVARALPRADLAYFADTAHLPYGNKPDSFIRHRVLTIGRHLATIGCEAIIVACNTATVAAVRALRDELHSIPVVGIEPGVKPAAQTSLTRRIAVLATESTARSERLAHLIREHANDVHVHVEACAGWATRIETLELDRADFADEVRARVEPLLARDIDRLVLGCTHYSFIAPLLSPITRGRAELVDVAEAVARQTVRVTLPGQRGDSAKLLLQASAHPERLHVALHRLGLSWLADRAAPAVLMHVD